MDIFNINGGGGRCQYFSLLCKSGRCCGLGLRCSLLCYTQNNALAISVSITEISTALPSVILCVSQRSPSDSRNAEDQTLSEALWFLCLLEFHENAEMSQLSMES